MEAVAYLDTHVVFWLYAGGAEAPLSPKAREAVGTAGEVRISPIVRLELQYLYEVERIGVPPAPILDELAAVLGLRPCEAPFSAVIQAAEAQRWTRDPFDRIIVSQAALHDAPLVTKDRLIRDQYAKALW